MNDKDKPEIMPKSDSGEDERQRWAAAPCAQGWEAAGQLHQARDARIPWLLWQPVISARGQGVRVPTGIPGEQWDATRGCPVGTGQEAPAAGSGVMERAVEVTRGAGGCDPRVEEGSSVLWRGNFGGEVVVKDLLW